MCGIYGWSFKGRTPKNWGIVSLMLAVANDSRGGHSYGYFDSTNIVKNVGYMTDIRPVTLGRLPFLMAHTRYATTGGHTQENAHPFAINGLIGAHNGIVYNHFDLNNRYQRSCTVDSQHIFHQIAAGLPTDEVKAYGAIEYVMESEPNKVWLAKFNGGELSAFRITGHNGVVWSSTAAAIREALFAAGIAGEAVEISHDKVYWVVNGEIWTDHRLMHFGTNNIKPYTKPYQGMYGYNERFYELQDSLYSEEYPKKKKLEQNPHLEMTGMTGTGGTGNSNNIIQFQRRAGGKHLHDLYLEHLQLSGETKSSDGFFKFKAMMEKENDKALLLDFNESIKKAKKEWFSLIDKIEFGIIHDTDHKQVVNCSLPSEPLFMKDFQNRRSRVVQDDLDTLEGGLWFPELDDYDDSQSPA